MGLFSFLRKSKKESISTEGEFHSRAEEESNAIRGRGKRSSAAAGKHGEAVDPVLPEKKRARRRLVGAIALVLAVIIFLPMILDSVPKPVSGDIEIQIPSKDKPFQASRQQTASTRAVTAPAPSDPKEKPADPVATPAEEKSVPLPATAVVAASKDKKEEAKASEAVAVGKPAPAEHKAESNAPAKPEAKAQAKPETRPEPKPQQALVTTTTSVARVPAKASDSTEEAARANAILEGRAVDKAEAKAVDAKPSAEKKTSQFILQVAALASKEKVSELQNKLLGAGIKSYTQKVATKSGERIRVRIGPFAGKEEAERVRAKLNKLGLNGTLVPA